MVDKRETFIAELEKLGFKPEDGHCEDAKVLVYKTGFYMTGNYHQQVLSGLHDLQRLVEVHIKQVEEMDYPD